MAALRAEFHEAGRIAAHYGPSSARDGAALVAVTLFVAAVVAAAIGATS